MSGTIRIPMSAFYDYGRDKVAADHKFRDGWDRIFGKKEQTSYSSCSQCGWESSDLESFHECQTGYFDGDCD